MDIGQFEIVEKKLCGIPLYGKKVGLNNIEKIIFQLNKKIPLNDYLTKTPIIHVAGTNGKGSVCKMLSQIYEEAGYSVGLFTSPHIDVIMERIQINNKNVDVNLFLQSYEVVSEIIDELKREEIFPTFFEWMFSMALYALFQSGCNVLIIEVGVGGRLDTTNVLKGKALSVITPIGFDHQGVLGDTIELIAMEKAGIIEKFGKVVFYNENPKVEAVIDLTVQKKEAQCFKVLPLLKKIHESRDKKIDFSIQNKYYYYENLRLMTKSKYQIENTGIVLTCIEVLREILPVNKEAIIQGVVNFYWPGRFEEIIEGFIIDGAHNELGARILVESLKEAYQGKKLDLVIAMKEGKDFNEILSVFMDSDLFEHFYVSDLTIQKCVPKQFIYEILLANKKEATRIHRLEDFLNEYFKNSSPGNSERLLIGAGSLYFMSEIREIINRGGFKNDSI